MIATGLLVVTWARPGQTASTSEIKGEEPAVLTPPSRVPPPISRKHATKVVVNLEVIEKVVRDGNGVARVYWTFAANAPGSVVRVREGDLVEFNLKSHPGNRMPHKIEVRPVTGRGDGAASPLTAPGQTSGFSFRAMSSGVFVFRSETASLESRNTNGLFGLILVEPKDGLPKLGHDSGDADVVANLLQRMLRVDGFTNALRDSRRRDTAVPATRTKKERVVLGERIYDLSCRVCHQANGQGIPELFPPLAKSDYLMADKRRSIEVVTRGLTGKIEVNGMVFDGVMSPVALDDDGVANVLTFVRNSWGNTGDMVTREDVLAVRDASFKR